MPRQRVNLTEVTVTAVTIVDRESLGALSLTSVAGALGIRPSALYTYFANVEALRYAVAVQATVNLTERLRDVAIGQAGDAAVRALAVTYRRFAIEHPGQFSATLAPPSNDTGELALASAALTDVFARVITSYGHEGEHAIHVARVARSAIHGFVALELSDSFGPTDPDVSFEHLVDTVIGGLVSGAVAP